MPASRGCAAASGSPVGGPMRITSAPRSASSFVAYAADPSARSRIRRPASGPFSPAAIVGSVIALEHELIPLVHELRDPAISLDRVGLARDGHAVQEGIG